MQHAYSPLFMTDRGTAKTVKMTAYKKIVSNIAFLHMI